MSAGRCRRRMTMGRGADGGCGREEKICPVARVSSHPCPEPYETLARRKDSPAETSGVSLYEQARKTLTERSPFGAEEQAATERVATLPVALAVSLSKHSDSRRKHKNPQADHGQKAAAPTATSTSVVSTDVWADTQEYFRPITLSDIDHLIPTTLSADDPCFQVPSLPFHSLKAAGLKDAGGHVAGAILKEEWGIVIDEEASITVSAVHAQGDQSKMELDQNPMDIDHITTDKCDALHDQVTISKTPTDEQNEGSSLSWLLGLKNRALLSSERPNKKRRLLGSDAGLERLLKFPQSKGHDMPCCDYCCFQGNLSPSNQLLNCANCKVFVHQRCYGVGAIPTGRWLCSRCQHLEEMDDPSNQNDEFHCLLCSKKGGALKPVGGPSCLVKQKCKFVHLFCSLWVPELYTDNVEAMGPIMNTESVPETWKKLSCSVCKLKGGVCIRCSNGTCRTSFHPMCAREAKHQMEVWGKFGCDNVKLRVFCLKHSELMETNSGQLEIVAGLYGTNCSKQSSTLTANEPCETKLNHNNSEASGTQQNALNLIHEQVSDNGTNCGDTLRRGSGDERIPKEKLIDYDVENGKHGPDEPSRDPMVLKKLAEAENLKICDVPHGSRSDDYLETSLPVSREFGDMDPINLMDLEGKKANGAAKAASNQHNLEGWTAEGASPAELCDGLTGARVISEAHQVNRDSSRDPQTVFASYIHPFILKRLFDKGCYYIFNHKTRGSDVKCSGLGDDLKLKELSKLTDIEVGSSDTAKCFQLQELSSEDEVEGELVRLQNRLIDTCLAIKSQYGNLMVKFVKSIAQETCDLRKQRWDTILVNQFLREAREAKKRGRKEKRLREAQAILASAAMAAASSCLSSVKNTSNDGTVESGQEEINNVDATCGSGGSNSSIDHQTRGKPSKLTVSKLSLAKTSDVSVACCDICQRAETLMNPIFICGGCKVAVHLDCYRRVREAISSWFCELCVVHMSVPTSIGGHRSFVAPSCSLCGTSSGAFRKTSDGRWVHAFCAEWVLGTRYRRGQEQPVEGLDEMLKVRGMLGCCICHQNIGVTVKCCYGHCQAAFHPICARSSGLYLNLKTVSGCILHRKAYCAKHSQEQREKSNLEHIGVEEFKSLRQIRVELEKLRLLCERIVKREKLKREFVLCSHDILASRRDYVAFSVIMRSSLFSSGLSSESATTSVNNTSYSGTVERSDDVTVDSTVTQKPKAVIPLHIKIGKGSDRSRSNLSIQPGVADRMSLAGKQLPQRPPSFHTVAIPERRFKSRRSSETFQKEVLMTLDQASQQNQRLPKGFAYVPMECLSKPHDTGPQDRHKPDG